jgi:hypothetical protein
MQPRDDTHGLTTAPMQPRDYTHGLTTAPMQPRDDTHGLTTATMQPRDYHGLTTAPMQPRDDTHGLTISGPVLNQEAASQEAVNLWTWSRPRGGRPVDSGWGSDGERW